MTQDELVDLGKVMAEVTRLAGVVTRLDGTVQMMRNEVKRLQSRLNQLPCGDCDTSPDCPVALPESHREKLQSITDEEDSIVRAAVGAATQAAIDAVKSHKSGFPFQITTPGGWALKLSAVGAGLIGFGFAAWELARHANLIH